MTLFESQPFNYMFNVKKLFEEKYIHLMFEVSLLLKGLLAIFEAVAGILVYVGTKQSILRIVDFITQGELAEDPRDFIANHLLHWVQRFSVSSQHFLAIYLVSHGAIKIWLVAGLLRKKLWYYPVAIALFGLFIVYQLYLYSLNHSIGMLAMIAVDAVVIVLVWHEYAYLRRTLSRARQD